MSNTNIKAAKISVDVCRNDPVDIKAGGTEWLGFDFFVDEKSSNDMIKFIKVSLEHLSIPLASIGVVETLMMAKDKTWGKERILEVINREAEYLNQLDYEPNFIILDDDTDMDHLIDYLVKTSIAVGLTKENVDEAIIKLTKKRTQ